MTNTTTLRPGLLVAIKTSLVGNVSYATRDIEREHDEAGARIAKWETTKVVADSAEHEAAIKARGAATWTIKRLCASTAFGLLCPESRADELTAAIAAARAEVDAFNANARITRIRIYVIAGRVAADDAEAARAIRAELAAIMADMKGGVEAMKPEAIREAARRATELGEMLADKAKTKVDEVVEAARATARAITKAAKAGEQAALAVDAAVVKQIAKARTAFLDLDNTDEPVAAPAVPVRSIDLEAAGA